MTDPLAHATAPSSTDRNAYSEYAAERVQLLNARIEEGYTTEADARSEIAGIVYGSMVPVDSASKFLREHNLLNDMNLTDLADRISEMLVDKVLVPGDNGFSIAMAAAAGSSPTGWAAKWADGRFGAQHVWRCIMRARKYGTPYDPQTTYNAETDSTKPSIFDAEVDQAVESEFDIIERGGSDRDTALDLCAEIVSRRSGLRQSGKITRGTRALILGFGLPEPERPEAVEVRERLLDELRDNPHAAFDAMQAVLSGEVPEDGSLTGLWSTFNVKHLSTLSGYTSREEIAYHLAYTTLSPVRPLSDLEKKSLREAVVDVLPDEPKARKLSGKLINSYVDARAEIGSEFTSLDTPLPKAPDVMAAEMATLEEVAASIIAAYPQSPLGRSITDTIAFLDDTRRRIEHGGMATLFEMAS